MVHACIPVLRPRTQLLLEICREVLVRQHVNILHLTYELRYASQGLHPLLATRSFAEAPEVRQYFVWYSAALIRYANDHVL